MIYAAVKKFAAHWQGVRNVTLEVLYVLDAHLTAPLIPGGRTVAQTLHHIAAHEYFAARGVFEGRWEPHTYEPDADWERHLSSMQNDAAALRAWLQQAHAFTQSGFRQKPEQLQGITTGNPWFQAMPGWLQLHHAYQYELHHRGQLAVLIRQLGLQPPAMYAEENESFWQQHRNDVRADPQ